MDASLSALVDDNTPPIEDIQPLSAENLHAAFYATSSSMTVHNDTLSPLAVNIPDSSAMSTNFPNETIQPDTSDKHNVSVSWYNPGQSWFDVTFNGGYKTHTLLGSGQNSTSATPLYSGDGKVGVMVSPMWVTPAASQFDLDYFVGPGTIPLLVNSFVQANLPAILDHINTKGILKVWNGITIGVTNIGMNSTDALCSYAGMSNVTSSSADVNVIVRLNNKNTITGSAKAGVYDLASLTLSLTNFALMLRVHVDLTTKTVQVTSLKMSLDDYSVPPMFWIILALIPGWNILAGLLKLAALNANTLASAINNTKINSLIIEKINDAIKNAISGLSFGTTPVVADPGPVSSADASVDATQDFSTWMSSDALQGKNLQNIHLPGSHDSGAYDLSSVLPNTSYPGGQGIKYDDIKFLWALKPSTAPSNGNWPFGSSISEASPVDLGPGLYNFVLDTVVRGISQAGDQNFTQQLKGGIRWFDLRIYHDNDGHFYMQHGLRGPSFDDVLRQIKAYLDAYPSAKELIFLNLSHADFDSTTAQQVAQLTTSILGNGHLLHFPNDQGSQSFNFQSLASHTLASLTNGSTKIVLLNSDSGIQYPAPITNSSGFAGSDQLLWNFNWCRTPDVADIVPYVLGILRGHTGKHLQALATEKNGQLEQALRDAKTRTANVVAVDWFQLSSGKAPVPQIIALNN